MLDALTVSIPVIAGAVILFILFCAALISVELKSGGKARPAARRGSGFPCEKKAPFRSVASRARPYPKATRSFYANGLRKIAPRRTA